MKTGGYRKVIASVLAVLLLGIVVFAAQGERNDPRESEARSERSMRGRGPRPPGHMGLGQILRRLDLTQQQAQQIREIMEAERETSQTARQTVGEARRALDQAVFGGSDEASIRAAGTKLSSAITDEAVKRGATMTSVRKVLTEEQLSKLSELTAQRQQRREEFRKGGQGAGRGQREPGGSHRRQGRQGRRGDRGPSGQRGLNIERLFERFDSDSDGKLSRKELEAMSEQRRDRPPRPW